MPLYTYECPTHGQFTISSSMADYKPQVKCESCKKLCDRDIIADANSVVTVGDATPKTLGGLADRQTDKMSSDRKEDLRIKHNAYKEGGFTGKLPEGWSHFDKPSS